MKKAWPSFRELFGLMDLFVIEGSFVMIFYYFFSLAILNVVFCHLKGVESSDTYYNMDKHWGTFAKWNKTVIKRQTVCYFKVFFQFQCMILLILSLQYNKIHRDKK